MKLHSTCELPAYWDKFVALERRHYGPFYVEARERILGQWLGSHFFFCHFGTNERDEVCSVATFVAFTRENFKKILAPEQALGPKSLDAFTLMDVNEHTPWLYFASMIISDKSAPPFLVRAIGKEIQATCKECGVSFDEVVSISVNKRSEFLLKRYNFEKIGTCKNSAQVWRTDLQRTPIIGLATG